MKWLAEGIGVLDNIYLRNEELIKLAEGSNAWRQGTAGNEVKNNIRITDVFDIDPKRSNKEKELMEELIDSFLGAINVYGQRYPELRITRAENFRVLRYKEGGFYKPHIDSINNQRIVSVILYLNDDFEGGKTVFPTQGVEIEPKAGRLVLFPSNFVYRHESTPITKGTKWAVLSWFS